MKRSVLLKAKTNDLIKRNHGMFTCQLQEQVNDLQRECDALKEANEKLISRYENRGSNFFLTCKSYPSIKVKVLT